MEIGTVFWDFTDHRKGNTVHNDDGLENLLFFKDLESQFTELIANRNNFFFL